MKELEGKNVLITTQGWFMAPNGLQYKAIWGRLNSVMKDEHAFGFCVNRANTNWFVSIGKFFIAGCQVLYCCECDRPNTDRVLDYSNSGEKFYEYERPTQIYISE